MDRTHLLFLFIFSLVFINACAAIPYIGPTLARLGATELITAGGISLTLGDVAIYFITDKVLEGIIEDLGAFCPPEFENKSYCILIGTDGNQLTGNFYVQGDVNQDLTLSVSTNNNPITCPLPKGKDLKKKLTCNVRPIKNLDDIELKIMDKKTPIVISSSSLKKGLELAKNSKIIANLKKGRKVFKFV